MSDFVLTSRIKKRIELIKKYTNAGIPVLIFGATATEKTASAEKIFEDDKIIKFSFSAETTIDQLIGCPLIDSSTNNIVFQSGPYFDAYKIGYSLILEGFNLASEEIQQRIETSIDLNSLQLMILSMEVSKFKYIRTLS